MLIELYVENFLSIKDGQYFSLVSEDKNTHNRIETNNKYAPFLSPVTAIWGANASGKSNILLAINAVQDFVGLSYKNNSNEEFELTPFLFNSVASSQPSKFALTFIQENIRYVYSFTADKKQVYAEALSYYPNGRLTELFSREYKEGEYQYKYGSSLKGSKLVWEKACASNMSFLSVAAQLQSKQLLSVRKWFMQNLRLFTNSIPSIFTNLACLNKLENISISTQDVLHFLKSADISIKNIELEEIELGFSNDNDINLSENIIDINSKKKKRIITSLVRINEQNKEVKLDLKLESSGTRKLYAFALPILMALKNGEILCIDELHSFLHPDIVRHIVELFQDPKINTKGAQLIFTTHETSILDQDLLSREQIWFTEKNKQNETNLYSLLEFNSEVKKKATNIEKGYLSGRYGAVPNIDRSILYGDK